MPKHEHDSEDKDSSPKQQKKNPVDDVPTPFDGLVNILSANVNGLDQATWDNLEAMAEDNDMHVMCLQETGQNFQPPPGWKTIQRIPSRRTISYKFRREARASTAPYDKDKKQRPQRGQEEKFIKASTPTGTDKADMVLVRPWIKWTELPYEPEANPDVQKYIDEQLNNTPPDEMAQKTVVEQMVLRPPQQVQLEFPGHEPLNLFNWHAPQDGTSMQGYSGSNARVGHEIHSRYIKSKRNRATFGDQNTQRGKLVNHYADAAIMSAGSSDHYSHAVVDKLLKPQTVDLKGRGKAFNNKGKRGCSDHDVYAVRLSLPKQ